MSLFILTITLSYRLTPQNTVDKHFFKNNQILNIKAICPVAQSWINQNPAFNKNINAIFYEAHYNSSGLCTELLFTLCFFDSINNKIDTSTLNNIEHNFKFTYRNDSLIKVDISSFSTINRIEYSYSNDSIIRNVYYYSNHEWSIKIDTVINKIKLSPFYNPYAIPILPEKNILYVPASMLSYILFNNLPFRYYIEQKANDYQYIDLAPGFMLRIE